MKRSDIVTHPVHGQGTVSTVSPGGQYAVVQYPARHGGIYRRTHRIADLEVVA